MPFTFAFLRNSNTKEKSVDSDQHEYNMRTSIYTKDRDTFIIMFNKNFEKCIENTVNSLWYFFFKTATTLIVIRVLFKQTC